MFYYVVYDFSSGYNYYGEDEIDYVDLEDAIIEFRGSKRECLEYIEYNQ